MAFDLEVSPLFRPDLFHSEYNMLDDLDLLPPSTLSGSSMSNLRPNNSESFSLLNDYSDPFVASLDMMSTNIKRERHPSFDMEILNTIQFSPRSTLATPFDNTSSEDADSIESNIEDPIARHPLSSLDGNSEFIRVNSTIEEPWIKNEKYCTGEQKLGGGKINSTTARKKLTGNRLESPTKIVKQVKKTVGKASGKQAREDIVMGNKRGKRTQKIRRISTSVTASAQYRGKMIGIYTPEERRERIRRFLEKRKTRVFQKQVKYHCRKVLAASCPRVRGRFVKRSTSITPKRD